MDGAAQVRTPAAPARAFFVGAGLNRRHTTLRSSVTISAAMWVALSTATVLATVLPNPNASGTVEPSVRVAGTVLLLILLTLCAIGYPAAREGYYRVTQPLRPSVTAVFTRRLLALVYLPARLLIFLALWLLAIPLGAIAAVALGVQEMRGRGWRIAPTSE